MLAVCVEINAACDLLKSRMTFQPFQVSKEGSLEGKESHLLLFSDFIRAVTVTKQTNMQIPELLNAKRKRCDGR